MLSGNEAGKWNHSVCGHGLHTLEDIRPIWAPRFAGTSPIPRYFLSLASGHTLNVMEKALLPEQR
jgi:hypothetical protein